MVSHRMFFLAASWLVSETCEGFSAPSNSRQVSAFSRSLHSPVVSSRASDLFRKISVPTALQATVEEKSTLAIADVEIPKATAEPLALLLVSQFILFIGVGAVIPSIPLYGKEIGLSSATNGLVISAPALALLLLAKPGGEYADKARKPAMMWGMALIALSDLGTALSQSVIPLVLARLGLGAGRCVSESGERGMLADFASTIPDLRGRILASQQAVLALGIAIGAPAGGLVVETYGPRAAFLCVTAAALVSLIMYNFLPETVRKTIDSSEDGTEKEPETVKWGELLKDSKWRGLSIFEAGAKWGFAAKISSIPLIAAAVMPGGAVGAGSLLSAAGLSGLAGAPLGGFLVDKFGAKQTMVFTGVVGGTALMSVPFFLQMQDIGTIPAWAAFCTSVLTWSVAVAAQNPSIVALAQEIAPEGSEATAMALPRASGDAMYLFAPFLLGTVADFAGLPTGSDCFVAGICGLIGVGALILL